MMVFWVSIPFSVYTLQHIRGIYRLHIQGDWTSKSGCWKDEVKENILVMQNGFMAGGRKDGTVLSQWEMRISTMGFFRASTNGKCEIL